MFSFASWIAISVVLGLLCAFIAKKKRKNPESWFRIGAILGLILPWVIEEIKKRKGGFS